MEDVRCLPKSTRIGGTRFFIQVVREGKRFSLLQSLQRNQCLSFAVTERESKNWEEHKGTLPLTQFGLRMLKS